MKKKFFDHQVIKKTAARAFFFSVVIFAFLMFFAPSALAAVLFQDTFESGDFSAWPSITQTMGTTSVTTISHRSGEYSFLSEIQTSPSYITRKASLTASVATTSIMFLKIHFLIPDSFVYNQDNLSVVFASLAKTGVGALNSLGIYKTGGNLYLNSSIGGLGSTVLTRNAWHCAELEYDKSGGVTRIYLDGVQEIEITGQTFTQDTNELRIGLNTNVPNVAGSIEIDDVTVSDERILYSPVEIFLRHAPFFGHIGLKVQTFLAGILSTDSFRAILSGDNGYYDNVYEGSAPLSSSFDFDVNLRNLAIGNYTLTVQLLDAGGSMIFQSAETFNKPYAGVPVSGIDENAAININGQPTFFVTPFHLSVNLLPLWSDGQYINTLYGGEFTNSLSLYDGYINDGFSEGLRTIGPNRAYDWEGVNSRGTYYPNLTEIEQYVNTLKDNEGTLMWTWIDEPVSLNSSAAGSYKSMVEMVDGWKDKCHELDPQHLVVVDDWATVAGMENIQRLYTFPNLIADVYSFDYYAIEFAWGANLGNTITEFAQIATNYYNWNFGLIPFFAYVETSDVRPLGYSNPYTQYPPTQEQVRMLSWIAIVHGAKGISWYHYQGKIPPENYSVMNEMTRLANSYGSVILSSEPEDISISDDANDKYNRVDTMIRETDTDIYVYAVRVTETTGEWVDPSEPENINVNFNLVGGPEISFAEDILFATSSVHEEFDSPTTTGTFSFTLTNTPIEPGTVIIGGGRLSSNSDVGYPTGWYRVYDDGLGNLNTLQDSSVYWEDSEGTIDYNTGEVSVTFYGSIDAGSEKIHAGYVPVGRERSVPVVDGSFSDSFSPASVHIYKISKDVSSSTASSIDNINHYAWSENVGWLDFGSTAGNVIISDSSLFGYVYGEKIGWIDLNPAIGGVVNDGQGHLTGYAWGENVGWILFHPLIGGGVTISSSTGEFSGYAYGENIGWISFNCSNTTSCGTLDYKVKTDWRPTTETTYTLTYTAGTNGSITGTSPQTVSANEAGSAVTAIPNTGYSFVDWSDSSTTNPRTDTNVTENISVTANFAINTYTITFNNNGGDTQANPTTKTAVNGGNVGTLPTAPTRTGYVFASWNTQADGNGSIFTASTAVTGNLTVYAKWTINTYTITSSAGTHGSISPLGATTKNYGTSQLYTIATTTAGYHINDVLVDSVSVGTSSSYTFDSINANHSISVTFASSTPLYALSYAAGSNGSITGDSPQTVTSGEDGTAVTAVANTGYHFVNWSDLSTSNPRTDTNVTGNISVSANFAINTYTITATTGANGTVSPSGVITLNYGASQTYTIATSTLNYHVADIIVDGDSVGTTSLSYTFSNVTANHTISATFSPNPETPATTYTVGGTISGLSGTVVLQNNTANNLSVSANGSFTFTIELANSASYAVTVLTNPNNQTCSVTGGTGTISSANVTSVTITCTTNTSSGGGGGGGGGSAITIPKVTNATATADNQQITLNWTNPSVTWYFNGVKILRKQNSAPASSGDTTATVVYTSDNKLISSFVDTGLIDNQKYYYAIYSYYNSSYSQPTIVFATTDLNNSEEQATSTEENGNNEEQTEDTNTNTNTNANGNYTTLYGLPGNIVDQVSQEEAKQVREQTTFINFSDIEKTIYQKVTTLAERALTQNDKYNLAYFIHDGTQTTKIIGAGERGGSIASFHSAFGRLPKTELDWQDIIKIANGRWPTQRSLTAENRAKVQFKKVYLRDANMNQANDNAAVTVMAYGLRPANRNMNSEKVAILTFKYVYKKNPSTAEEWDVVRAIAYSGSKR
ncbi:MAG: InlB B-repeat-containing protein [Patescibacteria group bacterium]|jgi:uncharacterized repeat protein (TIGR02543 family)